LTIAAAAAILASVQFAATTLTLRQAPAPTAALGRWLMRRSVRGPDVLLIAVGLDVARPPARIATVCLGVEQSSVSPL
jgi:hypothetical protein